MDEPKVDAPVEVYSLTREELQILVESQRRRIAVLERAVMRVERDVERAQEACQYILTGLRDRIGG